MGVGLSVAMSSTGVCVAQCPAGQNTINLLACNASFDRVVHRLNANADCNLNLEQILSQAGYDASDKTIAR